MSGADLPFGIDFGGTGIKGAPVDLEQGGFAAERVRIKTPKPSTPEAVAEVFVDLLAAFPDSSGAVGVTVPGVVRHGVGRRGARGVDADAVVHEVAVLEVDGGSLDARAAEVDAEGVLHGHQPIARVGRV